MFVLKPSSNHESRVTAAAGSIVGKDIPSSGIPDLDAHVEQLDKDADAAIWEMANLLAWEETKKKLNVSFHQEKDGTPISDHSFSSRSYSCHDNLTQELETFDKVVAADPNAFTREISNLSNNGVETPPLGDTKIVDGSSSSANQMDVSVDVTEMSEATSNDWMAAVAENAKLLQTGTERAKSFDIDYTKMASGLQKVQVPLGDNTTVLPGIRFTGSIGIRGRSFIANQPLPKPEIIFPLPVQSDTCSVCETSSVTSSFSTVKKPKMWKRLLRRNSKKNLDPEFPITTEQKIVSMSSGLAAAELEPIEFKPFVFPFKLPDGTMSVAPRMVSYYEVEIVPFKEDMEDTSDKTSVVDQSEVVVSSQDEVITTITEEKEEEERVVETTFSDAVDEASEDHPVVCDDEVPAPEPLSESGEDEEYEEDDCVAVGIAFGRFRMSCRMPGWDENSIGYHGDDGSIFYKREVEKAMFGPAFTKPEKDVNSAGERNCSVPPRNIVGCGINYSMGAVFFTRNGEFLGYAVDLPKKLLAKDWYPAVGVDSRASLICNFGYDRPFAFDLQGYLDGWNSHQPTIPDDPIDKISGVVVEENRENQVVG
ncbi:SPRY domain containing protein [Nitzschia inconspicua]|uniref:SPRY domain containing protein n=1 Tax=Nitzschia inconspicua TaxID=303405 RepID=A0A9K3PPJ9_9STRA|nr:SPRY domain containing protein [Nitzschia inconspicua]